MGYAENTKVPVERSKIEIERTLLKYGADDFMYGSSATKGGGIMFRYKERLIKIGVPFPNRNDYQYDTQYDREYRRRWRVLLLALKAKLELVDAGLVTFEDEFLAQTCLPDGTTIADTIQPQIQKAITEGNVPTLLLPGC